MPGAEQQEKRLHLHNWSYETCIAVELREIYAKLTTFWGKNDLRIIIFEQIWHPFSLSQTRMYFPVSLVDKELHPYCCEQRHI